MLLKKGKFFVSFFASMTALAIVIVSCATVLGEFDKVRGWTAVSLLFIVFLSLIYLSISSYLHGRRIKGAGKKAIGRINSVRREPFPRGPLMVRYSYLVEDRQYDGAVTTMKPTEDLPKPGSNCTVFYDEHKPVDSILDQL